MHRCHRAINLLFVKEGKICGPYHFHTITLKIQDGMCMVSNEVTDYLKLMSISKHGCQFNADGK